MARIYSLCLTTQSINDKDKTILFRLADKINDELQEPNHYIHEFIGNHEESGYSYPYTSSVNHNIGELMIWEWDPFVREWAKKTSIPFYELINTTDITSLTEESFIDLLKKGYDIPNYFGQKALVVIREELENYIVLEMDSSIASTIKGVTRLNKNAMKINGYILSKNDFLYTDKVVVLSSNGETLPPRKVYKYLNMNEPDFIIDTLSFEEKLELFVSKEIKVRSFTRSQQKQIKNLFNEILTDYGKIQDFFEENGFNGDGLIEKINKISKCFNDVLNDNSIWTEFCKVMIEAIPELTDKFNQLVERKFIEENRKQIESMNTEIVNKEKTKEDLSNQCDEYEKSIVLLETRKVEFEQRVKEMENIYKKLETASANKVIEVKRNMAEFISEVALLEQLGISVNASAMDRKNYSVKLANHIYSDIDVLNDINEFIDVLDLNLKIAGVESENSKIVSKFVTGTIKQQNKIFLIGRFASNVADAISAAICGKKADIITVFNSNVHLEDIIQQIKGASSKVVLIENIISLNESVTLQLLKKDFDKLIIFSNDLSETINFIPNSLLIFCNLIFLDYISEKTLREDYVYTDATNVKFESNYNKYTYKAVKEELEKLINKCIYSSVHCAIKSELISIIDDIEEKEGIYSWLLCEAIPHQLLTKSNDDAEEIISLMQLSEKNTNKLQNIVG